MDIRFSDMDLNKSGANDFVIRDRSPSVGQVILIFICALVVGISLVASVENKFSLILLLFSLFTILGWYMIYQLLRSRDMLLATEFQNALFTSAMGLHNKFTIIIKRDGSIVYLDRAFQDLFPGFIDQPHRSIDMLLKVGKVVRADSEKVYKAIDNGVYDKVVINLEDSKGATHNIMLSVEPILRPAGFTMLRGREFIEQRKTDNTANVSITSKVLNKTSTTLFSHIIDSMNIGVYITSPTGDMVYTNSLFDSWLGYAEGEIAARNLNLRNIAPPKRNEQLGGGPIDFEGPVQFEQKNGNFIKVFINQKVIRNEANLPMGCTTIVNLLNDKQSPSQNNSW